MQRGEVRTETRRVAIVAVRSVLREGLRSMLGAQQSIGAVSVFDDVRTFLDAGDAESYSIVLFEQRPTGEDCLQSVVTLKAGLPGMPVLTISYAGDVESIAAALRAGTDGYILGDDRPDELRYAIESVSSGRRYLSRAIYDVVIGDFLQSASGGRENRTVCDSTATLTERERQMMRMIAGGLRTREIASQLSLSPKTVEKHRASLMRKLGLSSAPAVAAFAIARGFVTL